MKLNFITLPDLIEKAACFVWGHDWRNNVCKTCGAKK